MRGHNVSMAALVLATTIGVGLSGCASKSRGKAQPAPQPPAAVDLSLEATVPSQAGITSVSHDGGAALKPGDPIRISAKATAPPGYKLEGGIADQPWSLPLEGSAANTFAGSGTVPQIAPGSYTVYARLLDASGNEVARKNATSALMVANPVNKCAELRAALDTVRVPFDTESDALKNPAMLAIGRIANLVKAAGVDADPGVSFTVEGHCDERGTTGYNVALGDRRARAVGDYLKTMGAFKEGKFRTVSFGEERPIDPGHTEAAWAANRRAEVKVTCGSN